MAKVFRHSGGAYSLVLPDDWVHADKKSTTAFFQPETGVGAINVSEMMAATPQIDPVQVALEFLPKTVRSDARVSHLKSPFPGAYTEYQFKDDSWRLWVFWAVSRIVAVSYNCQTPSKGVEDLAVDEIVGSLVLN